MWEVFQYEIDADLSATAGRTQITISQNINECSRMDSNYLGIEVGVEIEVL